jgi:hypothetical protein
MTTFEAKSPNSSTHPKAQNQMKASPKKLLMVFVPFNRVELIPAHAVRAIEFDRITNVAEFRNINVHQM